MALFTVFVLIFPAVGIWLGWTLLRDVLHRRKFGPSTLKLEKMPGRLGQELQGRLHAGVNPEQLPEDGIEVQLSCYRRVTGPEGRTRKRVGWQENAKIPPAAISRRADGVEVPISFDVPADHPPSPPKKYGRIEWELDAIAPLAGLNYDVAFTVPIFEGET